MEGCLVLQWGPRTCPLDAILLIASTSKLDMWAAAWARRSSASRKAACWSTSCSCRQVTKGQNDLTGQR